jgi:hypothetical protein
MTWADSDTMNSNIDDTKSLNHAELFVRVIERWFGIDPEEERDVVCSILQHNQPK